MSNNATVEITPTVETIFGADSLLAQSIKGFQPRAAQLQLARAITAIIEEQGILVAEAGTGTGKTYAYLIPILLANQKAIVSTGTKTLQDQLFHRDIPLLRQALALPLKIALLKGRSNYLCKYRLENIGEDTLFRDRETLQTIEVVRRYASRTRYGEINEITQVAEDSPVWPYVTSTNDNCLGQDCEFFKSCYVVKARRKALEADIVVVNHHLFFADLALKEDAVGELLPKAEVIVLDEAHQLPEIASTFFGLRLSSRQLIELARDTRMHQLQDAKDMQQLADVAEEIEYAVKDLRLALGKSKQRAAWDKVAKSPLVEQAMAKLADKLAFLQQLLEQASSRSKALANCWQRSIDMALSLQQVTTDPEAKAIHWFETFSHAFALHATPLSVAEQLQKHLSETGRAWVFTSATLAVDGDFSHFTDQMGLYGAQQLQLDSPFDYSSQALLYVPRQLPDPNHQTHTEAVLEHAIPLLNLTQGRCFILFTSYNALAKAAQFLPPLIDFPVLVQGTLPKDKLLEQFRAAGNAVLLATSSFWEGVDVRGDALSCVIIDKLPFAVPDDPVYQARATALRRSGQNPFQVYTLPQAVITLKQGTGRLIRDVHDRGVLVICDPRLVAREYGKLFVSSLPYMPRTREFVRVKDFFECSDNCS